MIKLKTLISIFIIIFSVYSLTATEKLHLKIGTYENSPKIFTDANGEISGFWADITNYIAHKEDWEIEWIQGNWDQCLQRLENNEIDIMVDVGITPAREERFAFSDETVLLSWSRLYTHDGTNIQSILDLEGKKIGGLKSSFNIEGPEGLKDLIEKFNINCDIIEMDNYKEVFEALKNKEIDAGITNKDFGALHENEYQVNRTSIIFQPAQLLFAFPKDSQHTSFFIEKIDLHIKKLVQNKNSIYYSSMEKYLGGYKKETHFPFWILLIIISTLLLSVVFIFIFNRILNHQIVKQTAQLRNSEEKYRTLTENLNVGIYRNSPGKDGKFIEVNPAFLKIFDYEDKNAVLQLNVSDFYFNKDDRNKFNEELQESDFVSNKELLLKKKDGSPIYCSISAVAVKENNNIIHYDGIIEDITERKQADEEIIEKSKELDKQFKISEKQRIATTVVLQDLNKKTRELKDEIIEHKKTEIVLKERMNELEIFNDVTVDREIAINDLRKEINDLLKKLGEEPIYEIVE